MTEPSPPVWPDPDPGWRVRWGVGLLAAAPLSDAQREAHAREDAREAAQLELQAQQARERAHERRWELQRQGREAHTVDEVIAAASFAQDRADRREQRVIAEGFEAQARPKPRLDRWELRQNQAEREAAKETTPATQADLGRLEQALSKMKSALHAATGHKAL